MAVLAPPIHIRGDTLDCMRYIQDPEKIVANNQTANVMRYMQSHCVEEIMSVGYNGCSGVRELAIEQFRSAEEAYRAIHPARKTQTTRITVEQYLESNHRKKLPKHIKPDPDGMITVTKSEVTAEHIILSLHRFDKASPAKLQAVVDEFMTHEYLQNFPAISNLHWNTDEKHAHILISNYATDGARKLSLSGTKLRELRRHLDRICVAHGMSIIDTQEARLDPEHAAWIDKVKADGKVRVWPENYGSFTRGGRSKQQSWAASQYVAGEKKAEWIDKKEGISKAVADDLKEINRNGWFVGDGTNVRMFRRPDYDTERDRLEREEKERLIKRKILEEQLKRRYYFASLRVYDEHLKRYRERSMLELIYCLLRITITGDTEFLYQNHPSKYNEAVLSFGKPDYEIQALMDAVATTRDLNVDTPDELRQRQREIGSAMEATKKAIKYDETTLSRVDLYEAIQTWQSGSMPEEARKAAYAVLASHKCTSYSQQQDALERYLRAKRRLPENREHLEELKKDYRRAKHAVATLENARVKVELYNDRAREAAKSKPELDAKITQSETRAGKAKHNEKAPTID